MRFDRTAGGAGRLFAEDFDLPQTPPEAAPMPEPEPEVPPLTWADVEAARAQGRLDGLQEAASRDAGMTAAALTAIATELEASRQALLDLADEAAVEIVKSLMAALATALPDLCARHGDREVTALARKLLQKLQTEPKIQVQVNAAVIPSVQREIDRLKTPFSPEVILEPLASLAPGDLRMRWKDGIAVRDAKSLCDQIVDCLLNPEAPPSDDDCPPVPEAVMAALYGEGFDAPPGEDPRAAAGPPEDDGKGVEPDRAPPAPSRAAQRDVAYVE